MDRRTFIHASVASASVLALPSLTLANAKSNLARPIPSTNELIPCVGMGTWITFDVSPSPDMVASRTEVLRHFYKHGGGMIDSSPMYGTAEKILGKCFQQLEPPAAMFSATKVWTPGEWLGVKQMQNSQKLWGLKQIDLMQIHNLLDWETHLKTLREWKESERIRYLGITTSHGRRHEDFIKIMQTEPLDFVQFTYNITHVEAEKELLPIAADRGIAVIVNRPFDGGRLFNRIENTPLPEWTSDFDCKNWAQYFLKFILAHPAVTVAIPATSQVEHMEENMGALLGELPDAKTRKKMQNYFQTL